MTENSGFSYKDVLTEFGEEKVAQRYDNILDQMNAFIQRNKWENKVTICSAALNQFVIDYFTDIYRLKKFHKIDLANYIKITAYTAYWLVRRKPLQVIEDDPESVELAFCNENFTLSYILRFLQKPSSNCPTNNEKYRDFVKTLSYSLRYRVLTPQMIELMISGYLAGRAYQMANPELTIDLFNT